MKERLRRMAVSSRWASWREGLPRSRAAEADEVTEILNDNASFWPCVQEAIEALEPAYALLRTLDSDRPTLANVYYESSRVCLNDS